MSFELETEGFDLKSIINEMARTGAVSVPILPDKTRIILLDKARELRQPDISWGKEGAGASSLNLLKLPNSVLPRTFSKFRKQFAGFLEGEIKSLGFRPFAVPFDINFMELIGYQEGSDGLSPHVDSDINMTFIFMLGGIGHFYLCDDRAGRNPREIDTTPGNVIIMKGLGFLDTKGSQYHYTGGIESERYVLSLRQTY
jgi:hypothetical protein